MKKRPRRAPRGARRPHLDRKLLRSISKRLSYGAVKVGEGRVRERILESGISFKVIRRVLKSAKYEAPKDRIVIEKSALPPGGARRRTLLLIRRYRIDKAGVRTFLGEKEKYINRKAIRRYAALGAYKKNIEKISGAFGISEKDARKLYRLAKEEGRKRAKKRGRNQKKGARGGVRSLLKLAGEQSPTFG